MIKHSKDLVEELPEIIFLLTYFFERNQELLKPIGIFRVAGQSQLINELSIHLSLRDFHKLS